jgi:hydrogenase nickel incorporation protein HypA/HybF
MHELSLAQNIIDTVQHYVPQTDWERVTAVRLKIGICAGVVKDSLEFSFQAITADSLLRSSRLEIESIPFRIQCGACNAISESEIGYTLCPTCGSTSTKIISGTELQITEIEVEEPEVQNP